MKKLLSLLFVSTIVANSFAQLTPTLDDIYIPMRDGDSLQADVYIPAGVDSSEVILIQTPYNKDLFAFNLPMGVGQNIDAQAYIWVIVDWRGFYGSNQADVSNTNRGEDGYDVCDWIVSQSWHKDRIGTWGPSALGGVQYSLAAENHPNHTCAVPMVATGSQGYDQYFYGGVLEEARLYQLDALGYGLSPFVLANHYDSWIWQAAANSTWYADDLDIPTLQIGGWYDHAITKMMEFYTDSRNLAGATVQDEQYLLVGPWVHGGTGAAYVGSAIQGELTYPDAEFKSDSMAWDFFNYYLLDSANNWQNTAKVTYYDMGSNQSWITTDDASIQSSSWNTLFLNPGGKLESTNYPGQDSSSFISDPSDPSPTIGGATLSTGLDQGPHDQSSLDNRSDVISFETATLQEAVSITGQILVNLSFSLDQPDCDIAIRLVDVYPTGENMLITDGIQRMRFRDGDYTVAGESFMNAGELYTGTITMPFCRYTWQSGHKIKIYVSANHDSRFNVNLQDGGSMYQAGVGNTANIQIHHGTASPSSILLPGNNPSLQITEEHSQLQNLIYPNPANDWFSLKQIDEIEEVRITNLEGQEVLLLKIPSKTVNIEHLSSGVYQAEIRFKNQQKITQQFIKN